RRTQPDASSRSLVRHRRPPRRDLHRPHPRRGLADRAGHQPGRGRRRRGRRAGRRLAPGPRLARRGPHRTTRRPPGAAAMERLSAAGPAPGPPAMNRLSPAGAAAVTVYVAAIVAANIATNHFGLVSVGFGYYV